MSGELDLAAGVGPLAHRGLPELLLERVGPELGVAIGTMMVQPAVLDACAFVSDVRRRVLSGYPTKLHGAANMGFMRLYCTRQVWAEVPRVLEDDADQLGIDAEEALSVWFGEYHPLVKVVDTTTLQGLASLPGLSERDASDLPTADLIGLLAPVLAFSTDKDLAGVTVSRWVASSQATAVAGLIDSATFGAVTGTAWVISNREQIITPVRKVAASPQLPRVLLGLGVLALAAFIFAPEATISLLKKSLQGVGQLAVGTGRFLGTVVATRVQALSTISEASCSALSADPLLHACARALAVAPVPLNMDQLARAVRLRSAQAQFPDPIELAAKVAGCSAFVEIDGGYQLGRSMQRLFDAEVRPPDVEVQMETDLRGEG